jgi:putative nucleotidyltransferase with HDIG domain
MTPGWVTRAGPVTAQPLSSRPLTVPQRRARIRKALHETVGYERALQVLSAVLVEEDAYTGEHTDDVVQIAVATAQRLRMRKRERQVVELGALLHDIGKIATPKAVLGKPGPLTPDEWAVMRRHVEDGEHMLRRAGRGLVGVARVVRASHERWDGTGYPDHLVGDAIPLAARIIACADAFSAMTTDRPYRRAMAMPAAIGELRAGAGSQFDPRVVEAMTELLAA